MGRIPPRKINLYDLRHTFIRVLRMDLQKARDWADLLLKSISVLALILGGGWAYYQFLITDTTASNVQLTVSTEYQQLSGDGGLLLIHAKPKNIGKVSVQPGKDGFLIIVRSIDPKAGPSVLDLEKLPEFYKVNLMNRFPDGYELEPGVEYDEVLALVVPKGSMYAIKATLDLGDDTEVDHTVVAHTE